jgi:radical SAM protein with 4Fe4S-binding SPASM domain
VFRREHFGALVYDRETMQYVPYDAQAAALLLARQAGRLPSAASAEELAFLEAMRAEELLDLGATQGCNLACGHCQADSGPGPLGALDGDVMASLFREQAEIGCMQVHVTGGEPLLHPGFFTAVDEAFRVGLNVLVTTNGTLITEELAEQLAERPFRCVSVSVDGPDAASNDAVRGEGSLARSLEGLARLAAHRPVGITATFTPHLAGRIPELVELCQQVGAASLTLRPALPSGRALRQPELVPSESAFLAACEALDALQETARIPLFHPPQVPHQFSSNRVLEHFGCVAGNLVCSVSAAGQVNPCALLGPTFDSGSLRERPLRELWAHGSAFVRLRELRGNPDCWRCAHYDHCGGGCRARALAAGRDLNAPDPWCSFEPLEEGA